VLAIATLVNRAGTMVLPFMAIYLTRERGLSVELAGGVIAAYGAAALVAAPLAGRFGDRLGTRRLAIGLLALSGAVMLVFPLAKSTPALVLMIALLSFLAEGFRPLSMAMFGQLAPPERRKQAFALHRLAVNLGMTIGPATGGLLVERWFTALFVVDGITSIASACVLFAALKFVPAERKATQEVKTGAAYADRRLVFFLAPVFLTALIFFQLDAAFPLYLMNDVGLAPSVFGAAMSVNTVVIIFLEVPLNAAIEAWPTRRALALGAVLVGMGFSAVAFATGFFSTAGAVLLWTFGEMILFPASAAYVSEIAPEGRSGEYMGLYSMTFAGAFVLGPWAGAALMERAGASVLWVTTLAVGLASALMFALVRPAPQPQPAPA
jgi:MFS family permease